MYSGVDIMPYILLLVVRDGLADANTSPQLVILCMWDLIHGMLCRRRPLCSSTGILTLTLVAAIAASWLVVESSVHTHLPIHATAYLEVLRAAAYIRCMPLRLVAYLLGKYYITT